MQNIVYTPEALQACKAADLRLVSVEHSSCVGPQLVEPAATDQQMGVMFCSVFSCLYAFNEQDHQQGGCLRTCSFLCLSILRKLRTPDHL